MSLPSRTLFYYGTFIHYLRINVVALDLKDVLLEKLICLWYVVNYVSDTNRYGMERASSFLVPFLYFAAAPLISAMALSNVFRFP